MNRIYYLALISLYFLNFMGCKANLDAGVDVAHATLVTFDQLREVTKDEKVFWWLGCDADYQYFRTKKGFYRMTSSSEHLHESWIQRAKQRFDRGAKVGEVSLNVAIRDNNKIGLPPKGVDPNLSYPPLD